MMMKMMMVVMIHILTLLLPLAAALTQRLRRWGRGIEEALLASLLQYRLHLLINYIWMRYTL